MAPALALLISPNRAAFMGFPHSARIHLDSFSPGSQGDSLEVWGWSGQNRQEWVGAGVCRRRHKGRGLEVGKRIETLGGETGGQPVEGWT